MLPEIRLTPNMFHMAENRQGLVTSNDNNMGVRFYCLVLLNKGIFNEEIRMPVIPWVMLPEIRLTPNMFHMAENRQGLVTSNDNNMGVRFYCLVLLNRKLF